MSALRRDLEQTNVAEVDPLLKTPLSLHDSMQQGTDIIATVVKTHEDDHDDPLSRPLSKELDRPEAKTYVSRTYETWNSLIDQARLGRREALRTKKILLRGRLAALREDLEEDEIGTNNAIRDTQKRHWVLELLARDVALWWERGNRSKSLRAACLLAGALAVKMDNADYARDWVLVVNALTRLREFLQHHLHQLLEGDVSNEFSVLDDGRTEDSTKWNWYYKIGSIRGLVTRLYLQACTWSVVGLKDVDEGARLYMQSAGIGDPLVRQYFVAYLVSQGMVRDVDIVLHDTLKGMTHDGIAQEMLLPLSLTFSACTTDPTSKICSTTLEMFQRNLGYVRMPTALQAYIATTPADIVAKCSIQVLDAIETMNLQAAPLLVSLVAEKMLLVYPPLDESHAKAIMNSAWRLLNQCEETVEMNTLHTSVVIDCSAKFMQLCCTHYGPKEMLVMTKELERRLSEYGKSKHSPAIMKACLCLCSRVESNSDKFCYILSSESFARLFENLATSYDDSTTFTQSSPKSDLAKRLLELFLKDDNQKIDLTAASDWAKALHDAVHSLTFDDDRKQIIKLLRRFMEKAMEIVSRLPINLRLTLLTDLRGRFFRFESLLRILIMNAATVGHESQIRIRPDLAAGCLAFCHSTIPSLSNPVERGMFYATVAMVAMRISKLPQADGFFKASIQSVAECCSSEDFTDRQCLELIRTISSSLVVAPGHPSGFYLVRGLTNAILKREWLPSFVEPDKTVIRLVEVLTRTRLPYRISGTDSNDILFGDDASGYLQEAMAIVHVFEARIKTHGKKEDVEEVKRVLEAISANILEKKTQVDLGVQKPILS